MFQKQAQPFLHTILACFYLHYLYIFKYCFWTCLCFWITVWSMCFWTIHAYEYKLLLNFILLYKIIIRFWKNKKRAKESTKRKLKASEENGSWSQSAPEDKVLMKSKCSWRQSAPEVMTSSEGSSSEASHQKLKITRSCSSLEDPKLKASKVVQWI